jgi:hypothetical protein
MITKPRFKVLSHRILPAACCLLAVFPGLVFSADLSPHQMAEASVSSTEADWKAIPKFSWVEEDRGVKDGVTLVKAYQVTMIDGSPYSRPIAVGGKPLSLAEQAREGEKLREEIQRRADETPEARAKRIADYQKGRDRMLKILNEMPQAFDFKQAGQEVVGGHQTYVLEATPRRGYEPKSMETKMLTAMRGKLWIDKDTYQWVKVEAAAFRPLAIGWFIAEVLPGTKFCLEQQPFVKALWLPERFSAEINAKVLCWQKHYVYRETYSSYHDGAPHLASR